MTVEALDGPVIILGPRDIAILARSLPATIAQAYGAPGRPRCPLAVLDLAAQVTQAARDHPDLALPQASGPPGTAHAPSGPRGASSLLSAAEAAQAAGVSAGYLRRLLRAGDLPGVRDHLGGWRVDPADLAAWLARREAA